MPQLEKSYEEKSEGNCRKILSKARRKVGNPGKAIRRRQNQRVWIEQFLEELRRGNVEKILSLLAEDVIVTSDGGGKVTAALRPVISAKGGTVLVGIVEKISGCAIQGDRDQCRGRTVDPCGWTNDCRLVSTGGRENEETLSGAESGETHMV